MKPLIDRRTFTKTSVAAALGMTALQTTRVLGANNRIRLGVIGTGGRGGQVIQAFLTHTDVEIAALCDVSRSTVDDANARLLGGKAAVYGDFRKLIDRDDLDAVVIATPDHWHAIQTITACRRGQGRVLREAAFENHPRRAADGPNRAAHRAGGPGRHAPPLGTFVPRGGSIDRLGQVGQDHRGSSLRHDQHVPLGIGKAPASDPPKDLDWDLWLGPRPQRPFQATITPFKFRWWDPYATRFADNGVHFLDVMRWLTGDERGRREDFRARRPVRHRRRPHRTPT
jgi:hypothetical protein